MTKTLGKYITEKQLERDMRTLLGSLIHTQTRLRSVLDLAKSTMDEIALERSPVYTVLFVLEVHLKEAFKELCNELGKDGKAMRRISRSHQSAGASSPQSHSSDQKLAELERQRKNLLFLVCRILQASPGYKLRPSELAVETVGDLSCLSREARACLYNRMERGYYARTAIEDI